MVDYLVQQRFCPTEAIADPVTGTKLSSVTYLTRPSQVLAILQVAKALAPEKNQTRFEELFPIWSILWFYQWLQTLDPHDSYYRFNLEHGMALLLLELENDSQRRARLAHGLQTQRRALKFQANAYFNLVELLSLGHHPESLARSREEIEHENRHLLAEAFGRPAFIENVDLSQDPDLDLVEFRGLSGTDSETISRQPVPVPKRPGADFLWQRSPFALKVVWDVPTEIGLRSPNIDLTLPYWMARKALA